MRLLFAVFVLSAAACGGRFEMNAMPDAGPLEEEDGGTRQDAGEGGVTQSSVEGSYDLVFTKVTPGAGGAGAPPSSPSEGHAFRIDLRKGARGTLTAVVTSRWGEAGAYGVDLEPSNERLNGKGTWTADRVSDRWDTFTLDRGPTGALTGTFLATGTEMTSNGDVVYSADVTGNGTLGRDTTAPEIRIAGSSLAGPAQVLLPWDPVDVQASEPVEISNLTAIRMTDASGELPIAWDTPVSDPALDWAGRVHRVARRKSFEPRAGSVQLVVSDGAGHDLVGYGTSATTQALTFLDLPGVTKHVTFGDVVTVGIWGAVKFLGGKAPDPACESGGCAELEYKAGYCNVPRLGLAARLDASSAHAVTVRYRLLVRTDTNGPPTYLPSVFTVQIAPPGVAAQSFTQTVSVASVQALPAPVLGYAYGTAWTTATFQIAPSSELGFALYAGSGPTGPDCGFVPAPVPVAVLVDGVAAE